MSLVNPQPPLNVGVDAVPLDADETPVESLPKRNTPPAQHGWGERRPDLWGYQAGGGFDAA